MKEIGFGIIGFGRQGLRLAEHIRKDVRFGKLIAICRRSETGKDYAKEHNIKFYSDHYSLLKDKDIDAVIITTPSSLHGAQALDALRSKKHLLIDKPIASTVAEGQRVLTAAKRAKISVAINFPLRVNSVTKILKSNLSHVGKLKKIQVFVSHGHVRSEWQKNLKLTNGGVILDLGSHYFDLISFLTGCQPEIINTAYGEQKENENSGFADIAYKNIEVSIILLRNQKLKKNVITCAGEKGSVFADYVERKVVLSTDRRISEIDCPAGYDFEVILNNLVRAINKKEKVVGDAEAGLQSLKTALAIYKVIKTGRPVRL